LHSRQKHSAAAMPYEQKRISLAQQRIRRPSCCRWSLVKNVRPCSTATPSRVLTRIGHQSAVPQQEIERRAATMKFL
jgi:hypothetical protein